MKNIITATIILSSSFLVNGQMPANTDEEQIKSIIIASFDEIWSELNEKNIDNYYTKDFLLLEHGEVWNNDTISNYLKRAALKTPIPIRVNSFDFIDIKIGDGMAWVAYKNQATFTVDGKTVRKAVWLESATAILTTEGWKLQMLHSTRMKSE